MGLRGLRLRGNLCEARRISPDVSKKVFDALIGRLIAEDLPILRMLADL